MEQAKTCVSDPRAASRVVIVTGAANGIGRAIAVRFAADGHTVALVDRDQKALEALALENEHMVPFAIDVQDEASASTAVGSLLDKFKCIDVLVNNAGIVAHSPIVRMDMSEWRNVLDINLTAAASWMRLVAPPMVEARWGRIVNISSHAALLGSVGRAAYAASKAGLLALTRVAAVEFAESGITVNAVAPGAIETERTRAVHTDQRRSEWIRAIPARRYGDTADIAEVVAFLCSSNSSFITGQTIYVDGGFTSAGLLVDSR
jgi:NAD(P)-dependent dehydrogenase (short-subunit alcohol dehydrogenase family)